MFPGSLACSSFIPLPPLEQVSPCLQRATFPSSPMCSSLSCPPASEPSVTCHVSKLTNGLLPLPPLLSVSPLLQRATFLSSPTRSSLFLPSSQSSFPIPHLSSVTNRLHPLPPLCQG